MNIPRPAPVSDSDSPQDGQNTPQRVPEHYIDQLLVFQVEMCLFRIPANVLRASEYFREMLDSSHLGGPKEGQSDNHPIILNGITSEEMKSFLNILFPRLIAGPLVFDESQLKDALHLATMWSFSAVRDYCIKEIDDRFSTPASVDPFDRLDLADKCDVAKWRLPCYVTICERVEALKFEEGARLGLKRFAAVCRVREQTIIAKRVSALGTQVSFNYNYGPQRVNCPHAGLVNIDVHRALRTERDNLDIE